MFRGIVLALAFSVVVGCSGPGGQSSITADASILYEVADLMRAATQPNGKGPAKLANFNSMQSKLPRGYQAVKSGDVVVVWGVAVMGEGEGENASGGDVAAYEKDVPTAGGNVLLTSGEIKQMTAAEFAAAPKAGKK